MTKEEVLFALEQLKYEDWCWVVGRWIQ